MNVTRLLGVPSLCVLFAACSASTPLAPTAQGAFSQALRPAAIGRPQPASAAFSGPVVYASTGRASQIQIYSAFKPYALLGQITQGLKGPNALAVDTKKNLFVVNIDGSNVTEYPAGTTKPGLVITRGLTNPLTVAVGNDGTVYVSNYNSTTQHGAVLEYPAGQTVPSFRVPVNDAPIGIAVDAKNNLYATTTNLGTGQSGVYKFPPGSTKGVNLGITLKFAGRMAVDAKGNLIVIDQTAPAVEVFAPGHTKPSKEITSGFVDPFAVALNHDATRLFVADGAGKVDNVYTYPGLQLIGQINRSAATFGLALDPAAPI